MAKKTKTLKPPKTYLTAAAEFVGRKGVLTILNERSGGINYRRNDPAKPGIEIAVHIRDARLVYGNVHLLIEPAAGRGTSWVGPGRVRVVEEFPHEVVANEPIAVPVKSGRRAVARALGAVGGRKVKAAGDIRGRRRQADAGGQG